MLTRVRRSCTVQGHPAVPSLLSNVIVSPYGDSNGEIDVAITSRSLLKLKARHLFMIRVWDRFHAVILPGCESPALHCPLNRVREFLAQVSVSTLPTTSTFIPRSVHADRRALLCIHKSRTYRGARRASLLRDFPHINPEDGFLSRRAR